MILIDKRKIILPEAQTCAHHDNVEKLPKATFHFWESAFIPGLNYTETSTHNIAYGAHLHEALEIIWVRYGESDFICRDRCYKVRSGDVLIIAPNTIHAGGSSFCGSSFTTLQIPKQLLGLIVGFEDMERPGMLGANPIQLLSGHTADILYQGLIGTLPRLDSRQDQMDCLQDVLGKFFRLCARSAKQDAYAHPAVKEAVFIINSGFTESIDLYQLATELNLHQRYFISLFKTLIGVPPHQYQIALRIDMARRLLNTKIALSEVAMQSGFADQSHLNRHFKRIYGMPPGIFRDQTNALGEFNTSGRNSYSAG